MASTTIGSFLVRLLFDGEEFDKGTEGAEKRLAGFGTSLTKMGDLLNGAVVTGLKAAGAAMAAFAAVSVKTGADFEQAITTVAAVSGATKDELAALTDQARNLGSTTAFSATEAAEGMIELARAGLSAEESIAASESALLLAGASASSMTESTSLLASTLSQFQLDASESGRIADVFSTAMNNSQLSMSSLTEAMKFAGVTGQGFGMSLEETTAAVAQFRNLGLQGSMAGNAFKMAMLQATKETSKKTQALADLGLTMDDINPATKSFGEIMRTVGEAGLDATSAAVIFGSRAGLAVAGVAEQFANGSSTFDELLVKLETGAGNTASTYAQMTDTVSGQTAIVKSAFEELALTTFDTFGGGLKDLLSELAATIAFVATDFSATSGSLADTFDQSIRAAIDYLKANRENIAATFRTFAEATGQVVVILGKIAPLLDDIGGLIVTVFVANKVRAFVAALSSMVSVLVSTTTSVGGVRVAMRLLYAELVVMSGGTLALVAAIGALVVGLIALVSSSDDAEESANRLREAQEKQEKVEADQHQKRMARATEIAGVQQGTSLALVQRLAEEDRLTQALETRLGAVSKLTEAEIASGLEQGTLFEATVEGEQIVLDYAAALELAKVGGEEKAAANAAVAASMGTLGTRVFEAKQRVEEILSVQEEYNRLVRAGKDGTTGASFAFEQIADSVEDYRVQLRAARAEVEAAEKSQQQAVKTLDRIARQDQIAATKAEKKRKAEEARNRSRTKSTTDYAKALEKATAARIKFEEALTRESLKAGGDAAEIALANLRSRLDGANKVFDAEVEAARKAGADIEAIETRRSEALARIRSLELVQVAKAATEKFDAVEAGLRSESEALRVAQSDRRRAVLDAADQEVAVAEQVGSGVVEARARRSAAIGRLNELDQRENEEFLEARLQEVERVESAIASIVGRESEQIAELLRRRERAFFGFQRRRLDAAISFTRRREDVNKRFDQFLAENADLTADQIEQIERGRADALEQIDGEEVEDRRRRNLQLLADLGKAAAKSVATVAAATVSIAKKAGSALSSVFSSFTGGLSLSSLSGGIEDVISQIDEAGGSIDVETAATDFVDGLVNNATRFVETLVEAAPVFIERLGETLPDLIAKVAEAIPAVVGAIAANIGPVLDAIAEGIPLLIQGIVDAVPLVVDAIVSFLENGLPDLLAALGPLIGELIDTLVEAMPRVVDAAVSALPDLIKLVTDTITKLVAAIPSIVGVVVDSLPTIISELFGAVSQIIVAVMDAIPMILNEIIGGLPSIVGSLVEGILLAVVTVLEQLPALLDQILTQTIPLLVESLILMVAQIVGAVLEAVPRIIQAVVLLIPSLITSLIEMIPLLIEGVINALPVLIQELIVGIVSMIPDLVVAVIAALPAIVIALVEGIFTEILPRLPFLAVQLVVAIIQAIVDSIKELVAVIGDIFREAAGFLGDVFGKDEEGRGFIRKAGNALVEGAKAIGRGIKNLFNDTPGVMRVGQQPAAAVFAPNDLFVAAKDPLDLARMALSEVGSTMGARIARPSSPPPPMPSSVGAGQTAPIDIAVIAEGRVLDAVQVTALDRGHAPKMTSKLRKASGVTVGLDRGRRNPYSR